MKQPRLARKTDVRYMPQPLTVNVAVLSDIFQSPSFIFGDVLSSQSLEQYITEGTKSNTTSKHSLRAQRYYNGAKGKR